MPIPQLTPLSEGATFPSLGGGTFPVFAHIGSGSSARSYTVIVGLSWKHRPPAVGGWNCISCLPQPPRTARALSSGCSDRAFCLILSPRFSFSVQAPDVFLGVFPPDCPGRWGAADVELGSWFSLASFPSEFVAFLLMTLLPRATRTGVATFSTAFSFKNYLVPPAPNLAGPFLVLWLWWAPWTHRWARLLPLSSPQLWEASSACGKEEGVLHVLAGFPHPHALTPIGVTQKFLKDCV